MDDQNVEMSNSLTREDNGDNNGNTKGGNIRHNDHNANTNDLEEEDELMEEIDVCLTNEFVEELHIFQYPLRPNDKPYGGNHSELKNVMFNKDTANFKMTYDIEKNKNNFDTQYYDQKNFQQTLTGQKIESNTNYLLGVYKNNILYLNPVSSFVQFRNDFSHIEAAEASKKKTREKMIVSQRKESINMGLSDNRDSESKWTNLKFYKRETIQGYQVYDKLYFEETVQPNKLDYVDEDEYLNFFFSNVNKEVILDKSNPERYYSYKELMSQPLQMRIEVVLKKVPVVTFEQLKKYCNVEKSVKSEEFLEMCLKYARITKNGNLILKSEIRYDPSVKSDMCTKRNYVINLLQNNNGEGLKRDDIFFLENQEKNEILSEIAYHTGGKYYLKESNRESQNMSFINSFPDIYDRETSFWESISFKKNPSGMGSGDAHTINININPINRRKSSANFEEPVTQNNGPSTSKLNLDFIKSLILKASTDNVAIRHEDLLHKIYTDLKISIDENENHDLVTAINDLIKSLCYNINSVLYLKDVGEGEALLLRKALIEYLTTKKIAKRAEIKNHLKFISLNVPDSMLTKMLKSICVSTSNMWSLKEPY